jgi:hypothetical protein
MHHFFLTRKGRRVDDQVKAVPEEVPLSEIEAAWQRPSPRGRRLVVVP